MTNVELGRLEMAVLGLLDAGGELDVREVQRQLEVGGHAVAYTTVLTVLSRLFDKGVVERRKEGRRYVYREARSAAGVKHGLLRRLENALFASNRLRAVAALLDDNALTTDELKQLRGLVNAKLKERQ